jgi:stage II sporulation protein AA (anti-sigma F factor antagonist)
MKIQVHRDDRTLVLELEGQLDADGSATLEERCAYELQEGSIHFVIDLRRVTALTGPGLRVLLGLARHLPRAGGSLVLCAMERRVEEALRVSGLGDSFQLSPDRETALRQSLEIRSSAVRPASESRAEAEEKIAYAIALLAPRPISGSGT